MATTWDAATVTAVTLSGGNLVATNTGTTSADQGAKVASASGKSSGKYYFEATFTLKNNVGANGGLGISTFASTYTGMGNNATTGSMLFWQSGNAYTNGSPAGVTITALIQGQVMCLAVDLDNRKIWFRNGAAGNWNQSGTANPATNTGGITIPSGTMVPIVVFGSSGGVAGNVITANFGATTFTGTAPSGFTSGWDEAPVTATASYAKYNDFTEQLHRGKHDFGTHTFKIALSNTAPDVATHRSLSDISEITAGNGYAAGGVATTISISRTAGTTTISATDTTITAAGGSIANFRYVVLYNDSMTSPADGLVNYWDCGATQTVASGQSLVIDFSPIVFTHT